METSELYYLLKSEKGLVLFQLPSKIVLFVVPQNNFIYSTTINGKQCFPDTNTTFSLPALRDFIRDKFSSSKNVEVRVVVDKNGSWSPLKIFTI